VDGTVYQCKLFLTATMENGGTSVYVWFVCK